ncbi:L-serine ammonia-lyase, iron-sulfur-dependent, subunit alpha [Ignavigranum ruoffiae]|uniref:L-serine ammonia-lyase, iron-sulfur-dependent, subunit alpha n=1 Tax=Ignavigranum ruoffiae TaxID=89093 RepID=UPI0024AE0F11|nr:L-serine ammonia-lyase, iron-sulfur-dependent, subunit alpha [Ignavigranum ruoffiae]
MSFTSLNELIQLCSQRQQPIYQVMLDTEVEAEGIPEEELLATMDQQLQVMIESVRKGTEEVTMTRTGIAGGDGYKLSRYIQEQASIVNPISLQVVANAMAVNEVNASMGRIVATPTAGSAGILPAVLVHALDSGEFSRDEIIKVMFTASALGLVIANRASISGAQGGCQAEIGSATSMAAGALVELHGGNPSQAANAVGLALKNSLGLVCDPVAGLVEVPCITRNGLHALTAMAAADMALAGVVSIIPPDEVIDAMDAIGNELPASLRETGIGGLAGTPTGKEIKERIFGSASAFDIAEYHSAYEIIGPVMVGPSSSHTAGAVRIANVARQLLGEEPEEVVFTLMDSFAKTYQGHGTDLALIAGILGCNTKDPNIGRAKELAEERGLKYNFIEKNLGHYHPNTVRIHLFGPNKQVQIIGSSIGGGKIEIQSLNDHKMHFSGEKFTLVIKHQDRIGVIAKLTQFIVEQNSNISLMANHRAKINGPAITLLELDTPIDAEAVDALVERCPFIEDIAIVKVD